MHRRRFIAGVCTATSIGVAGCLGDDGGTDVDTSSPDAVVESYHRQGIEVDSDGLLDLMEAAYHSDSPILQQMQDGEDGQGELTDELELESLDVTVVEEGLSESDLQQALGFFDTPSDERIAEIAAQAETARVEATKTVSLNGQSSDPATTEHVVATEDGEWQILTGF